VPEDLDQRLGQMDADPAAINKLAFAARGPEDAITAAAAVRKCTKPTLAMAMGAEGLLSRLAARKFGAWGTFAALDEDAASAPGQPTLDQIRHLYRWDRQGPETMLFGVIGWPIAHSMSPAIHNAALAAAEIDGLYLPLLVRPGRDDFFRLLDAIGEHPWLDVRGLSVTIPHKHHALEYVGQAQCDPLAVRIGAVNTITFQPDGTLAGDNTDYAAALDSLCGAMDIPPEQLAGRSVAVLGAGGVARAVVAALAHYHADVTIYNRTRRRAEQLAAEFDARSGDLSAAPGPAEIVINCTSVGMHPHVEQTPLESLPKSAGVVFDTIYNPVRTRLLTQARHAGATAISGLEMFVAQAAAQFQRWLARPAARDVMRQIILDRLG
jgi:3-dehydroquinate dehydratase/shikimate dehydrogenase